MSSIEEIVGIGWACTIDGHASNLIEFCQMWLLVGGYQ